MNTQRWIAVGILASIIACIASSNLWLAPLQGDDESVVELTPIAAMEELTPGLEDEVSVDGPTPEPDFAMLDLSTESSLNPAIVDIMTDMGIDELGVGIDPYIIFGGDFEAIDTLHQGRGTAVVYWFSELQRYLRLENFEVTNGPDLQVVLSQQISPRTSAEALLPSHLKLGALIDTKGEQNYDIPADTNLSQYNSVVIYSMSLNIVYTTATLEEVRGQ